MYSLLRSVPHPAHLLERVPSLVASLAIAEQLYRFGSFTAECLAFLATWFVLDAAWNGLVALVQRLRCR
jgi:hypothetical protein